MAEVRAAGGAVWRANASGAGIEVLVIHRPRYDDWSLPKGKCEPDESDEDCARREVMEETGFECELGAELPPTRYRDRHGRDKVVRYWAMAPTAGAFEPGDEVDRVEWLAPTAAAHRLTYEHDHAVLDALRDQV
jgi:8-oxo-dGTP diphosphatase